MALCALVLTLTFPSGAWALSSGQLERALLRSLASPGTSAYVRDLTTQRTLFASRAKVPRIPASVEKLYTTAAALRVYGPQARIITRVGAAGTLSGGVLQGDLYLIGNGDPTLGKGAIRRIARAVKRAGLRRVSGSVIGDGTHFDAERGGPRTAGRYDRDMGGVLGALTIGRGFGGKAGDPALGAARELVRRLRAAGVRVKGRTRTGAAPAGVRFLARSRSPQMSELVRLTNVPSDNFYAEMLAKLLGSKDGAVGTTAAGMAAVRAQLRPLEVTPRVVDGSGLSRANRTTAQQVAALLTAMQGTPEFTDSLAVAGRSGTLRRRLRGTPAEGACRGKTGTLRAVSTLAGLCVTREGHTVVFAFLMNGVSIASAHAAQDRGLRAIVAYRSDSLKSLRAAR